MSEIIPDTRDWTDVLAGGCSECGFTGTEDPTVVPATLAEALTGGAEDPDALAGSLVELALTADGPDNIGLALARV